MACEACKTIPPVVVEGYVEKGKWEEIAGLKTYVTGSATATKGIVDVYDIFGPASQTLQGADGLAKALGVLVLVPDLLKGRYANPKFFGSGLTEDEEKEKGAYYSFAFNFVEQAKVFNTYFDAAKAKFSSVDSWGTYGLCWGGKVVALASAADTPFKVSGQVHPGALATADAKAITIPHIVLASNGEDPKIVAEYKEVLEGKGKTGYVETYETQHHGWMGARANLGDEKNRTEYERGYNKLAEFFGKYL